MTEIRHDTMVRVKIILRFAAGKEGFPTLTPHAGNRMESENSHIRIFELFFFFHLTKVATPLEID